jgi:hypothetical protein
MSQFRFFKNREHSLIPLWTWMLLFSFGVHIALLLLPNTLNSKNDTNNTVNKLELEGIRVIELPSNRTISSPKDSPNFSTQSNPKANSLQLIDKTSESNSNLSFNKDSNNNVDKPLPKREMQQEQLSSKPLSTQNLESQDETKSPNLEAKKSANDPFIDFPKYPNAEIGSWGLLQGQEDLASQQTGDRQDVVASYFERELQARGYEIKILSSNSNQKVYQIFKGGLNKFLNLIARDGKGTTIVLAGQPLDINKLQALSVATQAEMDFDIVLKQLSQLGAQRIAIPEFYFAQPEKFYAKSVKERNSYDIDKPKSGFDGNFVVILDKKPEQLFSSFFAPSFQKSKFEVNQLSNYGGGLIFKVKQSSFVRYLNLLPTQSGVGTIVVIWKSLPM